MREYHDWLYSLQLKPPSSKIWKTLIQQKLNYINAEFQELGGAELMVEN